MWILQKKSSISGAEDQGLSIGWKGSVWTSTTSVEGKLQRGCCEEEKGRMQAGQRVHVAGLQEQKKKRTLPSVYSNRSNQLKIIQQFASTLNPKVKDWGSALGPFWATYSKTSLSWSSHYRGYELGLGGGLSQKDETICPAHRIQKTKMAAMKACLTWTLAQCRLNTAKLTLYVSIVFMLWQNTQ